MPRCRARALIRATNAVVVLCDHITFGRVATMRVAPIEPASRIITDRGHPPPISPRWKRGIAVEIG